MRWSEEDLARRLASGQVRLVGGELTPGQQRYVSEQIFQSAVMRVLKDAGFMTYHTHDSRRSPHGWPDVAAIKPTGGTLYLCELKREDGQVTPAQQAWLDALAGCSGVVAEIWRPSAIEEIYRKLR